MSFNLDYLPPLFPIDFFCISTQVPYAKTLPSKKVFRQKRTLPDMSEFLGEEKFADLSLFWNEEALLIEVEVKKAFEESLLPEYREGDSVEIFIDTRDLKNAGFATRFCHHFVFLPQPVEGIHAQEVTHFRLEDSHPLCDPLELVVESKCEKSSYTMQIIIPATCLHGYDPATFKRLGFTYRINRYKGEAGHFALSSKYYVIEKHPSLWASINLVE